MLDPNIQTEGKTILITGVAGFIGFHLAKRLFREVPDIHLVGIDALTDYYDVSLKQQRLREIEEIGGNWTFIHDSIANRSVVDRIFSTYKPTIVVNLAAQAGVRNSITTPDAYIESNIIGFYNLLEAIRHSYDKDEQGVKHFIFASSSSVYGTNQKVPYSTDDRTDTPVSLYAATKKTDELMAHAYAKLYNIPCTGLRFFTVYGPAGRPDMAYFSFTRKLLSGATIQLYNYGNCMRDFTYIDDTIEGIMRVLRHAPEKRQGADNLPVPPCKIYNIGNNTPERLTDFVALLQEELVEAQLLPADYDFDSHKEFLPMQPGDVSVTYAETTPLEQDFGFRPTTPLRQGLHHFVQWYRQYHQTEESKRDLSQ